MPTEIDEKALGESKVLDLAKPPVRAIEKREFPKMLYKHPRSKKDFVDHVTKVVANEEEMEVALADGWDTAPFNPNK